MGHQFAELAFTPTVRALQVSHGSRDSYAPMDTRPDYNHELAEREIEFITNRDSFYMATVSETGWPYIQHRGGPRGLIKILDDKTIGFADYSGNRQYISTGNLSTTNRVALFFMDYANQRRLKMLGTVETLTGKDALILSDPEYPASIERGFLIHVEAFDWNCPQHITPRFTEAEVQAIIAPMLAPTSNEIATLDGEKTTSTHGPEQDPVMSIGPLELIVSGMRQLTPKIRAYEFSSATNEQLPAVTAGAHLRIPIRLKSGELIEREYSITRANSTLYEIAVSLDANSRGGSAGVHGEYQLGTRINAELPINLFPLENSSLPKILIAGGIGITPIRAMADYLEHSGETYTLHYAGSERSEMAYLNELEANTSANLICHVSSEGSRLDVGAVFDSAPQGAVLYICGPESLVTDFQSEARKRNWEPNRIHFEKFS